MITAGEIADKLRGTLEGDGSCGIKGMAGLTDAGEGDISFLSNPKYESLVSGTKASAVIAGQDWNGKAPCTVIRVDDPDKAFAMVAGIIYDLSGKREMGVHASAVTGKNVKLGKNVSIGPLCVLEDGASIGDGTVLVAGCYVGREAVIGRECLIYPNTSIRERCRLGDRVIVHCGAVIGSDGFGYYREDGVWKKIPQVGIVEVGDDAEIGANVTIDRARFGKTSIGRGVKLDNLVQIAHNVKVGDNTAMAAQVGISGSSSIGKNVQIGGQAGVAGHLSVGDDVIVGSKAGVTKDFDEPGYIMGFPAMPYRKHAKMQAHLARMPELKKQIADLKARIEALERGGG